MLSFHLKRLVFCLYFRRDNRFTSLTDQTIWSRAQSASRMVSIQTPIGVHVAQLRWSTRTSPFNVILPISLFLICIIIVLHCTIINIKYIQQNFRTKNQRSAYSQHYNQSDFNAVYCASVISNKCNIHPLSKCWHALTFGLFLRYRMWLV